MSNFNEIAEEFEEQIPEHMRLHYMEKKTKLMEGVLHELKNSDCLIGLDLGCGLGWHSQKLSIDGYRNIIGLDYSKNMVRIAKAKYNLPCFMVGAAQCLPFKNESLDFVYSITAFHHMEASIQKTAFDEIERILKLGGYFFLHEINIRNPVFRLYMRHIFPRTRKIDTGEEEWLPIQKLNELCSLKLVEVNCFTFVPDFIPKCIFPLFRKIESILEETVLSRYGIHYMATFKKVKRTEE